MSLRDVHDFELALLDPCLAMSARGVGIDETRRASMHAALGARVEPLVSEVRALVHPRMTPALARLAEQTRVCKACHNGKNKRLTCTQCRGAGKATTQAFNPASDPQVAILLYDVLKLPKRAQVDEDTLKGLQAYDETGVVAKLLRITKTRTMQQILVRIGPHWEACPALTFAGACACPGDGRIRTFYNPAGTETGRFSSSGGRPDSARDFALLPSTNLQNMPKKEAAADEAYDVRGCLVPRLGHTFVEADLSGAEAWVVAALSGDKELLARLRDGADVHTWTAAHLSGIPESGVTKFHRFVGKETRHSGNYGRGWKRLMQRVNFMSDRTGFALTAAQAKAADAAYHRMTPTLGAWWREVHGRLMRTPHALTTCFGRSRTFFGRARWEWLGETHREVIAFEPQSTVADLLNRGLLRWWRQYDGTLGQLVMQVHDSLVIEAPSGRVASVAKALRACLREEFALCGTKLTIPVDVSTGLTWGDMQPL